MSTPSSSSSVEPTHSTSRITHSIKAPTFCPDKPALWFAQLEAQFNLYNVSDEQDKFSVAVAQMSTQHAAEVEDLIISPPAVSPYTSGKTALITRFSKSKEAKLRQLLEGESIGDRSPSSFLRHLKGLVPSIGEDVLRAKWTAALPEQTRALLATQSDVALEQQAQLADKLHEIYHASCAIQAAPSALELKLNELSLQISALSKAVHQSRSHKTSVVNHRSRSSSRPSTDKITDFCYYHQRFGSRALICKPGCNYPGNAPESR